MNKLTTGAYEYYSIIENHNCLLMLGVRQHFFVFICFGPIFHEYLKHTRG